MNSKQSKLHWFLIAYKGFSELKDYTGNDVFSLDDKHINQSTILNIVSDLKEKHNNKYSTIIIISINYLGYMTEDEFNG